jgi:uncharacterized protein
MKSIKEKTWKLNKSNIHGKGLFAAKKIQKGETIDILRGKRSRVKPLTVKEVIGFPMRIKLSKEIVIDPAEPFLHANHSCEPTMGIRGALTFVALRDLDVGDELTFDYSITEDDARWYMECTCGSSSCRKTIRSIHFLPLKTFKKYTPAIPTYFQLIYKKYFEIN